MKRYRQWLAEQQNHMTESPDGEYYLVIEVDAVLAEKEGRVRKCEDLAVEWKIVALDYNEQIATLKLDKAAECGDLMLDIDELVRQIATLKEEIWHLKGAMKADDLRLVAAAERVGELDLGCDIPEWLAETILEQREQIAALNPCGHTGFESTSCNICGYPDPRKLIVALTAKVKELESAMNLFGEDPSWCELLIEKCAEIAKQEEQIAKLRERGER